MKCAKCLIDPMPNCSACGSARARLNESVDASAKYIISSKECVDMPEWLHAVSSKNEGANLVLARDGVPAFVLLDYQAYLAFASLMALVTEVLGTEGDMS